MNLWLAIQAFFRTFKDPKGAKKFLAGTPKDTTPQRLATPEDHSHLRLLALLQQSGRLLDFLKEDITGYTDEQIGAAVRQIHQDCSKILEEVVTIRPVLVEQEGATIKVPVGYDPSHIKIVGKANGEPPYTGILTHKGWKAHKRSLPKQGSDSISDVIAPAEVEIR